MPKWDCARACDAYQSETTWPADPLAMIAALKAAEVIRGNGSITKHVVTAACEAYRQVAQREANPSAMQSALEVAGGRTLSPTLQTIRRRIQSRLEARQFDAYQYAAPDRRLDLDAAAFLEEIPAVELAHRFRLRAHQFVEERGYTFSVTDALEDQKVLVFLDNLARALNSTGKSSIH